MPTFGAGLRGMPRVNLDYVDTMRPCFIAEKAMELGKAPTMHTALCLTFAVSDPLANVRQILKDEGTPIRSILNNSLAQNMVVVSSLPKLFLAQFAQVALCRASAFGL